MARADFYLIGGPRFAQAPLRLVCELARKACDSGRPTTILAVSVAEAEALDQELWAFDPEAFVPHQIAGREADDALTPVLIAPPGVEVPARALLINLRQECPAPGYERVLEVVPADAQRRQGSRARWKTYRARGDMLGKHEM
ncbi:MAG TPA: DNA polymerase III subunit chi [Xanthomonadaceae bacterium]|nr:DNA polymerase III subunit chi [Xanthomonadaceae bacterium]